MSKGDGQKWAKPPKPRGDGDTSQYCEYHGRTGHKTDDCRHLKNAIEEQVRKGDLSKFVSATPETSADGSNKKSAFKRLGSSTLSSEVTRTVGLLMGISDT